METQTETETSSVDHASALATSDAANAQRINIRNSFMTDDRLITTRELASKLGVHPATIVRWIKAGIIPATRLGPRIFRIFRRNVQKILTDNN